MELIHRKHQKEFFEIVYFIKSGIDIRTIYCSVTPGGGKSYLPLILCELILRYSYRICWIVPRKSLQYQGEQEFVDWKSKYRLRVADNSPDPCRGLNGYITTYQAIAANPELHHEEFKKYKYILFLDEPHHVALGGPWHSVLRPLVSLSPLRIFASGTFYRGDEQKIAFLPYQGDKLFLQNSGDSRVIRYTRTDALKDKAIVPTYFKHIDGEAEWISKEGIQEKANSLKDGGDALFTALRTEYAYQLLNACVYDWLNYKKTTFSKAKLLVVAPNIQLAEDYQRHLISILRYEIPIATSKDDAQAQFNIAKYKGLEKSETDILITVAMAYEGLSVKPITHIACLTHIRSIPWLEQLFARGNRLFPGKKEAFVYGPADEALLLAIRAIENEQEQYINESKKEQAGDSEQELFSGEREGIQPLRSSAELGESLPEFQLGEAGGIDQIMSPSKIEKELKNQIRGRIKNYLDKQRPGNRKTATDLFYKRIKRIFGKGFDHMNRDELEKCLAHVVAETKE